MNTRYLLNPEQRELKLLEIPKIFILTQNSDSGMPFFKIATFRGEQVQLGGMFPKSIFIWFELDYNLVTNSFYIRRHETRYDELVGVTFDGVFARNRANQAEDGKYTCFKNGKPVSSYTVEEINNLPTVNADNMSEFTSEVKKQLLEEMKKVLSKIQYRINPENILDKRSDDSQEKTVIDDGIKKYVAQEVNNFIAGKRRAIEAIEEESSVEIPEEKEEQTSSLQVNDEAL